MEEGRMLCDAPAWDSSLFWDSDRPRLTHCFRRLWLTAIPCCALWIASLLDAVFGWKCGHRRTRAPCPWTLLAAFKQVLTCSLIACTAAEGSYRLYEEQTGKDARVEYLSVCARLVTYVLSLFLQVRQRSRGRLSSLKLTLFWTLMTACETAASPLCDLLTDSLSEQTDPVTFVTGTCSPFLLAAQAFLSCFTDPQYEALFGDSKTDEYLQEHQAPLSLLFFSWITRVMRHGYKNVLTVEDLDALPPEVRTSNICRLFLSSWGREERLAREIKEGRVPGWWQRGPSLLLSLFRVMWPWLLPAVLLELLYDFLALAPPIILDWLIAYLGDESEPRWHGPFYAALFFCTTLLSSLLVAHSQNFVVRSSVLPKAGLVSAIYRKVFRLSLPSRRSYSTGELCNLVSVDTQFVFKLIWSVNTLWSHPLRIALTLWLLWRYLGIACLAGLAATIALVPLTALIAVRTHKLQKTQMEWKDVRLRQMNEILNGIKVLKLFAWEPPFARRVEEIRVRETNSLRKLFLLKGLIVFLTVLAPFLVALCSFVTYVLLDDRNVLDPSTVFVSLTLFGRLRGAMAPVGKIVTEVVQSRIAFERLTRFLLSDELDSNERESTLLSGNVLELENASFSWMPDGAAFLEDLTFSVGRGHLVAIVGRVGAGKSALLSAILGEITLRKGSLRIQKGLRAAYVPQSAWIQNASLRQNVLFASPVDKRRYDSVVRRCCLGPDLRALPAGDHTEIGEKGVNLSGGQKQRVSLARAVYNDADLYLLDDPLSAVDAHVSRDLFADVIGPKGTLAQKTRLLVTHDLSVLPHCDRVLVVSDGRIAESGTYRELMTRSGGRLAGLVDEFARHKPEPVEPISPDPSSLTPEELKAQLRRLGRQLTRTPSVESNDPPSFKKTRFVENERIQVGAVGGGVYCSYFRSAGSALTFLVFVSFAAFQAFEIGSNLWLGEWSLDPLLPDGSQNVARRNFRMALYGGFGFAQGACLLLGSSLVAVASARASVRLHRSVLWRVMRSPLKFFETAPLGRILNRFGKDIQSVDVEIPDGLTSVVTSVVSLSGILVVICANYPFFLLVLLPTTLVYLFVQLFYVSSSRQMRRLLSVSLSPVFSFFSESVQGANVVRAFGCQALFTRRMDALFDTHCNVFFSSTFVNRWLSVRLQLLGAAIILSVSLLAVFQRSPGYSAALAGLTLAYTLNVTDLLGQLVRFLTQLETRMVSVERIDEYSKLEEEASWIADRPAASDWPMEGSVVFRGYKMRYRPDGDFVLKGIDLRIEAGQKVGVVGRTGAGKSSLALSFFRAVEPSEGSLVIDGIDVATLGLHDLRSRITVIPQDPVLFSGELRLSLDPTARHTDREVLRALQMAHLDIPLDTRLEEGGENLSLGQRQQACLARALLHRSRILVLDEATAAVDPKTDTLIQDTVRQEFGRCTVVTVAHRLHTVLDCDRILVMEHGRIVEDGPPDLLLKKSASRFKELAHAAGLC